MAATGAAVHAPRTSAVRRVTETLADATGRTDDEMRLVFLFSMAATCLLAALRVLGFLTEVGLRVLGRRTSHV